MLRRANLLHAVALHMRLVCTYLLQEMQSLQHLTSYQCINQYVCCLSQVA